MKCCICGTEIRGWGNNPWPVSKEKGAKCCDLCNVTYVFPARIMHVYGISSQFAKQSFS